MKKHPKIGHDIRDSTSPVLQLAASIALNHHEKFDGSGYPQALRGKAIPLEGRIVAADVRRTDLGAPPGSTAARAGRVLPARGQGSHFDPDCVTPCSAHGTRCCRSGDRFPRRRMTMKTSRPASFIKGVVGFRLAGLFSLIFLLLAGLSPITPRRRSHA